MRVALVYHSMRLDSGIPKMHVQLARFLVARGHDVHVYGNLADSDPFLTQEVTFHDVGVRQRSGRVVAPWALTKSMRKVGSMIRHDRPDVVHARSTSIWRQDIIHVTGVYRGEWRGEIEGRDSHSLWRRAKDVAHPLAYPTGTLRTLHERNVSRDPRVVVHSETSAVKRDLVSVHGIDPGRIRVVVPGVDTVTFSPEGRRVDLELGDLPTIAFLGHDYGRKGLDRVLEALARMKTRAGLVVIGGGTHEDSGWGARAAMPYEQLAARLGVRDRVRFLGAQRDVAPILRSAAVLAHPARFDVWGLAVTEGMAVGLPVVVSRKTGASELVDERSGWVLERSDDVDELAKALDSLLILDRRAAAGLVAREAAELISVERQGALVEADMASIAAERLGGRSE